MRISDWSSDVCSSDLAARAQLSAASTNVEATILRAAADGRIGDKSVRQGQFVQAASRLMTLVPKACLYVEANFRSEEHTSELQSLMRISYAVFCLKKKNTKKPHEGNRYYMTQTT